MVSEMVVRGAIVDSWLERSGLPEGARLVLQVATRERPRDLMIVEADSALVPDRDWLDDLGENLCHGAPVAVFGHVTPPGWITASRLQLSR